MDVKEEILNAATELFHEKGLHFTMDDVAAKLHRAKKTIYRFYPSKEDLLNGLLSYGFDQIQKTKAEILKSDLPLEEKLSKVIIAFPEVYQKLAEAVHPMHGQISGITSTATELAPSALSIMTEFRMMFSQPSNFSSAVMIRIHVIWAMRNGIARIVFHQSSIAEPINTSTKMFSFQMDETTLDRFPLKDDRVLIRGLNDYYFYYPVSSISWMESVDRSTHTMIHLPNRNIISIDRLRSFDANYGSSFLRVSRSIMVNPFYIRQLTRYQLLMDNGDIIPVPEKKYMIIKKELADWSNSSIKR